jgi:hypothetical protein
MSMPASPKPASPAERRARNREIERLRSEGLTQKALAKRFSISTRQVRRAIKEAQTIEPELVEAGDAEGVLRLVAEVQMRALGHLDRLTTTGTDNSNAAVGACRAAAIVSSSVLDTWSRAGALPSPRAMQMALEARPVVDALLRVAVDQGIDIRDVQERPD